MINRGHPHHPSPGVAVYPLSPPTSEMTSFVTIEGYNIPTTERRRLSKAKTSRKVPSSQLRSKNPHPHLYETPFRDPTFLQPPCIKFNAYDLTPLPTNHLLVASEKCIWDIRYQVGHGDDIITV